MVRIEANQTLQSLHAPKEGSICGAAVVFYAASKRLWSPLTLGMDRSGSEKWIGLCRTGTALMSRKVGGTATSKKHRSALTCALICSR
jgi:hypothetical protein